MRCLLMVLAALASASVHAQECHFATKPCFFLPPAPESESDFRLARRVHKT
jgi:hypothetical protein